LHDTVVPSKHRQVVIRVCAWLTENGKRWTGDRREPSGHERRGDCREIRIPQKFESAIGAVQHAENVPTSLASQLGPELHGIRELS
jgi:hypothetical protein